MVLLEHVELVVDAPDELRTEVFQAWVLVALNLVEWEYDSTLDAQRMTVYPDRAQKFRYDLTFNAWLMDGT